MGGGAEASQPTDGVEACVDRLLSRAEAKYREGPLRRQARRYARKTYCEPFARRGWVYRNGTLKIDAFRWLVSGRGGPGLPKAGDTIDCALLHHVPKAEVQAFLDEVSARGAHCDDGTPLAELGAA